MQVGSTQVSATVAATNLNFGLDVGLLGRLGRRRRGELSASGTVQFPSSDLTLTELKDDSLDALGATVAGTGVGSATLPVGATLGGTTISTPITLTVGNSFAGTPASPSALPASLGVFTNLSGSDILQALGQVGGWLDDLRNTATFATSSRSSRARRWGTR